MKITTWNVNSLKARMPYVTAWIEIAKPDVLCLQETKLKTEAFPFGEFANLGYESVHCGQGQWNGVAILSRVGLENDFHNFDEQAGIPMMEVPEDSVGSADSVATSNSTSQNTAEPEARLIWATCGGVRVASAYVPNGRELNHPHYHYKLHWLSCLRAHLDLRESPEAPVVVTGDFNIAPADNDVWDIEAFADNTHVSVPEREKLREVCEWGLNDVFRDRYGNTDGLYTYWDYRAGRFNRREGMRIDYILASAPLSENLNWIVLDRNARKTWGEDKPSDHAPLTASFEI